MDPYAILGGLPRSATDADVRRAFRLLSLKHHPDRGGDPEQFRAIQRAAEILQDPRLRSAYDSGGTNGLVAAEQQQHQQPPNPFAQFGFPAGFPGFPFPFMQQQQQQQQSAKRLVDVDIPLETAYRGGTIAVPITYRKRCVDCAGVGGRGPKPACPACQGRGILLQTRQIGPNMVQQLATACNGCNGAGHRFADENRCTTCSGNGDIETTETVRLVVPKGCNNNHLLPIDDAAAAIRLEPVAIFRARSVSSNPMPTFERRGDHLVLRHSVSILESLTGFRLDVVGLDGVRITALSPPRSVAKPGSMFRLKQKGMPIVGTDSFGDLIVIVDVDFPNDPPSLESALLLARALPSLSSKTTAVIDGQSTATARLESLSADDARGLLGH